ncbi:NAD(P)H-hydrate dehydratase [bacterium]|nr:NAD(P)H-hydrate dehydratase [bacterium]
MEMLLTTAEMREMDRKTIEEVHIPGLLLMEHAGAALAECVLEILEETDGQHVGVVCGKGNNGGDGFVAARLLFTQGWAVSVFLAGNPKEIRGDALVNFQALKGLEIDIFPLESKKDLSKLHHLDLVIDALLGTGISGEVTGFIAEIIDTLNQIDVPVVSVDVPSGLHCDDGQVSGACIEADATVTFGHLKRGLVVPPGRDLAGIVDVADIGIPSSVTDSVDIKTWLFELTDCLESLPSRPASAHKGNFGKAAVLAGSRGLTGAAALASLAALKAGGGLVVLGCPVGVNAILESKLTEVMTRPLPETEQGTLSLSAEVEVQHLLDWSDVLAIGPGLSQEMETQALIRKTIVDFKRPAVVDADGLNAIAGHTDLFKDCQSPLIITPHPGELARLTDVHISDIVSNPIEVARKWSVEWQCVLVLKGAPTVIGLPDEHVYVNNSGNSGMATAGSGDVLTGLIAGLLAQGCSVREASLCGVYLHGLAGDLAAEHITGRAMVAGDIIAEIGAAFKKIEACV